MFQVKKYIYVLLLSVCLCYGCTTITNPTIDYITPEYASYDEGNLNSGIWCSTLLLSDKIIKEIGDEGLKQLQTYIDSYNQGFIVSASFIERYNNMIDDYNENITTKTDKIEKNTGVYQILETKYYFITNEGIENFVYLNDQRKLLINFE